MLGILFTYKSEAATIYITENVYKGLIKTHQCQLCHSVQADAMGKSMLYMLVYGLLSGGRVSNSSHVGGVLAGLGCGAVFGPNFKKEYNSQRAPNRHPLFDKDQGYMNGRRIGQGAVPVYLGYIFLAILAAAAGQGRTTLSPLKGMWYVLRFPGLVSNTVA